VNEAPEFVAIRCFEATLKDAEQETDQIRIAARGSPLSTTLTSPAACTFFDDLHG
jgi:hypothetical protein